MASVISIHQAQDRLPELLDRVVETGEEYVVRRHGKDCAVIVSARQWRRRQVAGRLNALGSGYRLSPRKQQRVEELLAAKQQGGLSRDDAQELKGLLRECEAILLRRASALERLP